MKVIVSAMTFDEPFDARLGHEAGARSAGARWRHLTMVARTQAVPPKRWSETTLHTSNLVDVISGIRASVRYRNAVEAHHVMTDPGNEITAGQDKGRHRRGSMGRGVRGGR